MDSLGDVLLAGPAVRTVAAHTDRIVFLCGPRGRQAADMLPEVDIVIEWCAPWIDPQPPPVDGEQICRLIEVIRELSIEKALILTSFHQSPLPLALILRLAGVPWIGADCVDYPGSLLDFRYQSVLHAPEAARMLAFVVAAGFPSQDGDAATLRVKEPLPDTSELTGPPGYVVAHPGASVPARTWPPGHWREAVRRLHENGHRVVVTGAGNEVALTESLGGLDLGGRTSLRQLAGVLAGAGVVISGNTGPAHLAAAVGTPVVSLFAPVVPATNWAPYGVLTKVLGDQDAPCRDTRARECPIPGHPCLGSVPAGQVVTAAQELMRKAASR
ncbi:glycosyltransferase family 9 protein [Nonomuraea insulae]|uniref:Glycosyltransferase family 9 protein n=1 Tax=Nonomuraea insulae TaxID=1616787 RepID=A0ABW1D7L1_9ACTN